MELNYKDMLKALSEMEDQKKIPLEIVLDALKEAMSKAYKKDCGIDDINVETDIDEKSGKMSIYQCYKVTDDIEDDELEMSVEDAQEINKDAKEGDTVRREVKITGMSRAAASLARSVIRQKIREAEKMTVYNEYINQLDDMVLGIVESVKDRYVLVNLGKAVAMMPHSAMIPGENLTEGQKLRVVITAVNKDTRGSQVLVSRSDPMLVKRLFEKEVPEIFQGVVEIKAIARDAGERTKMAVLSHNEEVDPIGACIGPRGSRVHEIIEELHGEKIDIFQWSDDITVLVKNALAPAEILAVLPGEEDKSLLVVVAEDQLSLAIGKKGKNARLAVKLTDNKIDIKTKEELEEMGKDYDALVADAEVKMEEIRRKKASEEIARMEREAKEAEEKRQKAAALLAEKKAKFESEPLPEDEIPEEMQEEVQKKIQDEFANRNEEKKETLEAKEAEQEKAPKEETAPSTSKPKKRKVNLEEMKTEYVSRFEKLADAPKVKAKPVEKVKKKKRKGEEDEIKIRNKDLEKQLGKNLKPVSKPVYTEEELAEIQKQEQEEQSKAFDIDYDDYEDYYKDDEEN